MFCSDCGEKISPNAQFCKKCGNRAGVDESLVETRKGMQEDQKEIKRWSWGGFTLTWIYLVGMNGGWLILLFLILAFIPIVNFIAWIYLGLNGRKFAWERRKWKSLEEFILVQQKWDMWGIILFVLSLVIGFITGFAGGS